MAMVWLVYGTHGAIWPTLNITDIERHEIYKCSRENIGSMLRESIALDVYLYARDDNDSMTDIGLVR